MTGKIGGKKRTIGVRHKEHSTSATLQTEQSRKSTFYMSYPRKDSANASAGSQKGWFESKSYHLLSRYMHVMIADTICVPVCWQVCNSLLV